MHIRSSKSIICLNFDASFLQICNSNRKVTNKTRIVISRDFFRFESGAICGSCMQYSTKGKWSRTRFEVFIDGYPQRPTL